MESKVKVTKVENGKFGLYLVTTDGVEIGLLRKGRDSKGYTFPWQALALQVNEVTPCELLDSFYGKNGKAQALAAVLA